MRYVTIIILGMIIIAGGLFLTFGADSKESAPRIKQEEEKVIGTYQGAIVVDHEAIDGREGKTDYILKIETQDGEEIKLKTLGEQTYKALPNGIHVDLGYTADGYIKEITLLGGN